MHGGEGLSDTATSLQDEQSQWSGNAGVRGKAVWIKHLSVTVSLLGLSLVWSTEFAQAGPYLLHLGLSKSLASLVFLAGPLSGLVVQPLIGSYADTCKSRFGRRRPFIFLGGVAVVLSLLLFGFPGALADLVTPEQSTLRQALTLLLAIASIWTLDASINVVQAMDRALLVDVVPQDQQEEVNAWASRLQSVGSIVGYLIGGADLVTTFGFIANSQIKLITVLAILAFVVTHALTCWAVTERVLIASPADNATDDDRSALTTLKETLTSIHHAFQNLSPGIWHIFKIQFFSWFGLFSILFFSSTWITEIYIFSRDDDDELAPAADPELHDQATRIASKALMAQSFVFLFTSLVVPLFVDQQASTASFHNTEPSWLKQRWPQSWPELPRITLTQAWASALAWHSCLMAFSWFVSSWVTACVVIALTGVTMGMVFWAPYSILGEQILEESQARYTGAVPTVALDEVASPVAMPLSPIPEEEDEEANLLYRASTDGANKQDVESAPTPTEARAPSKVTILRVRHDSIDSDQDNSRHENATFDEDLESSPRPDRGQGAEAGTADSAGTILGLHNTAIVLPQLVVSLVASAIFGVTSLHDRPASSPGSDHSGRVEPSIGLALLFLVGGISTGAAAYYGFKGPTPHRQS